MKRTLLALFSVVGLLMAIVLIRTTSVNSRQLHPAPIDPIPVDAQAVARHLSEGLQIQTISHSTEGPVEADAFSAMHEHLRTRYPLVAARLSREVVSDHSLLYLWQGRQPELPALLLLAHQDVVPIEAGTESAWEQPPFSGQIADGFVWGRGAIDDKAPLYCIMEAIEGLLARGFRPERTVVLAFGHDEEVGGTRGAKEMAKLLHSRGIKAMMSIDEGGIIADGLPGVVERPMAMVGIAEKGYASVELSVASEGGHSSMPPRHTSIGVLSAAIARLEENPLPSRLSGVTGVSLDFLAPELPFPLRMLMTNRWLFNPLIGIFYSSQPTLDAMQRTTTAATIFHAGVKSNVLPSHAEATVNFRILPGDTIDTVVAHVERVIDDDRIELGVEGFSSNPSPVSRVDGEPFAILQQSIREIFPETIVAPYLVVGGTDSRHYTDVSKNLYRFAPFLFNTEDRERIHGTNERISIETLGKAVAFYSRLIELATAPQPAG